LPLPLSLHKRYLHINDVVGGRVGCPPPDGPRELPLPTAGNWSVAQPGRGPQPVGTRPFSPTAPAAATTVGPPRTTSGFPFSSTPGRSKLPFALDPAVAPPGPRRVPRGRPGQTLMSLGPLPSADVQPCPCSFPSPGGARQKNRTWLRPARKKKKTKKPAFGAGSARRLRRASCVFATRARRLFAPAPRWSPAAPGFPTRVMARLSRRFPAAAPPPSRCLFPPSVPSPLPWRISFRRARWGVPVRPSNGPGRRPSGPPRPPSPSLELSEEVLAPARAGEGCTTALVNHRTGKAFCDVSPGVSISASLPREFSGRSWTGSSSMMDNVTARDGTRLARRDVAAPLRVLPDRRHGGQHPRPCAEGEDGNLHWEMEPNASDWEPKVKMSNVLRERQQVRPWHGNVRHLAIPRPAIKTRWRRQAALALIPRSHQAYLLRRA